MNFRSALRHSILAVLILAVQGIDSSSIADDGILSSKSGLHSLVLESMASRGAVVAAEFDYKQSWYKDGERQWTKTGTFRFDERVDKTFHFFKQVFPKDSSDAKEWARLPAGVIEELKDGIQFSGGAIYAPDATVRFPTNGTYGYITQSRPSITSELVKPFEFKAFGFGMFGDISRLTPYDKVLTNFLSKEEHEIPEVDSKDLPKDFLPVAKKARHFNFGGYLICIEPEKQYWVTKSKFTSAKYEKVAKNKWKKSGEKVLSQSNIVLDEVKNFYLPVDIDYSEPNSRLSIHIEWSVVNPDADKLQFRPKELAELLKRPLR